MMKSTMMISAAALSALLLVAPVTAGDDLRTETVHFSDLDLRSDAAVRTLDYRLRSAATRVCGISTFENLENWVTGRECRSEALTEVAPLRDIAIQNARVRRGTVQVVSLTVKNAPVRN